MSIAQLIATQSQRTQGPSPMEQMSALQGMDAQRIRNQGMKQGLAQDQEQFGRDKAAEGLKFAANVSSQLKQTDDPTEKQKIYATSRQLAEMNGHDVSSYPAQYDENAERLLGVAYEQVYAPEQFKQKMASSFGMKGDITKSSKTYPNGLTIQSTGLGLRVLSPDGRTLNGQDAASAVQEAMQLEVSQQKDIYSARSGGTIQGKRENDAAGLEGDIAAGKKSGGDTEVRRSERISSGSSAAKGIPTLKRTLELLDRVTTGGPESISLALKQRLGVESADEGELSNKLGKAVLSQLKATFGAQFTEKEGARLDRIEANFSKNTETNRRLIQGLLKSSEKYAKQAIKDAVSVEDYATADAIKVSMGQALGEDMDVLGDFGVEPAETKEAAQQNAQGWQLMTDGQGNQAYVSPDGTQFEEL